MFDFARQFGVVIAFVAMFWSLPSPAPVIVGNGGDVIRFVYADAAEQAAVMLRDLPAGDIYDDSAYARWLWDHKTPLQEAVRTSEHVWGDSLPQGCPLDSCACVFQEEPTKVFLSTNACKNSTKTIEDAGRLVVHEAVHQLGVLDEQFADRVAMLVYHRWNKMNARAGIWERLPTDNGVRGTYAGSAAWNGQHLFIWGGYTAVAPSKHGVIFDSEDGSWRMTSESLIPSRKNALSGWVGGKFVVFGGESISQAAGASEIGGFYDLGSDSWQLISSEGALWHLGEGVQILTPHGLFMWGGRRAGVRRLENDAKFLDLDRNEWVFATSTPQEEARYRASAVWSGKEILIFGGTKEGGRAIDLSGLAYNPEIRSWRKIAAPDIDDDLNALDRIELLYVQGQVFVFGIDHGNNFSLIGRYVPEHDHWLPARQLNEAPVFPLRHPLIATADKIVALGDIKTGQSAAFDVTTGRWNLLEKNLLSTGYNLKDFAAVATSDSIIIWGGQASGLGDGATFSQLREGFVWRP